MQQDSPLVEFLKSGIKTGALEAYVQEIRKPLGERGVRTGVFTMYAPLPTMCLWTKGQRRRLLNRAKGYEAVLVLGCESAKYTAEQALKTTGCRVMQAMRTTGFTNANVKFHFPITSGREVHDAFSPSEVGRVLGTNNASGRSPAILAKASV